MLLSKILVYLNLKYISRMDDKKRKALEIIQRRIQLISNIFGWIGIAASIAAIFVWIWLGWGIAWRTAITAVLCLFMNKVLYRTIVKIKDELNKKPLNTKKSKF